MEEGEEIFMADDHRIEVLKFCPDNVHDSKGNVEAKKETNVEASYVFLTCYLSEMLRAVRRWLKQLFIVLD